MQLISRFNSACAGINLSLEPCVELIIALSEKYCGFIECARVSAGALYSWDTVLYIHTHRVVRRWLMLFLAIYENYEKLRIVIVIIIIIIIIILATKFKSPRKLLLISRKLSAREIQIPSAANPRARKKKVRYTQNAKLFARSLEKKAVETLSFAKSVSRAKKRAQRNYIYMYICAYICALSRLFSLACARGYSPFPASIYILSSQWVEVPWKMERKKDYESEFIWRTLQREVCIYIVAPRDAREEKRHIMDKRAVCISVPREISISYYTSPGYILHRAGRI